MAYKMSGYSYPGKSPLKQGVEHIDPLDLGLIDEAKKVKVSKPKPGHHGHSYTSVKPKAPKPFSGMSSKLSHEAKAKNLIKESAKKAVKKTVGKTILKGIGKVASRFLGPVGVGLAAYDIIKMAPKVTKATTKGLKKRAKSDNVNIGRKL